jgi:hypothetical protein
MPKLSSLALRSTEAGGDAGFFVALLSRIGLDLRAAEHRASID